MKRNKTKITNEAPELLEFDVPMPTEAEMERVMGFQPPHVDLEDLHEAWYEIRTVAPKGMPSYFEPRKDGTDLAALRENYQNTQGNVIAFQRQQIPEIRGMFGEFVEDAAFALWLAFVRKGVTPKTIDSKTLKMALSKVEYAIGRGEPIEVDDVTQFAFTLVDRFTTIIHNKTDRAHFRWRIFPVLKAMLDALDHSVTRMNADSVMSTARESSNEKNIAVTNV